MNRENVVGKGIDVASVAAATLSGIGDDMAAEEDGIGAVAGGSAIWNYSKGNYGLLAEDGREQQPLVNTTIVRPYPEAVARTPVSWSFDIATRTFKLTYHPDRSIAAPTVISIPPRIYPGGYKVDCGGCQTSASGSNLVVTTPPPGDPAVLTIRP